MKKVVRGARWLLLVLVLLASAVGGVALVAPGLGRQRILSTIQARCQHDFGATCTVSDVRVALDGALVRGFHFRSAHRRLSVDVDRVAARIQWFRLIMGREQGLDLRVAGVRVRGDGTLREVLDDVRPRVRATRTRATRRFRVDRLRVEEIGVTYGPRDVAGTPLAASVVGGTVTWGRDGGLSAGWRDAVFEVGGDVRVATGECLVVRDERDHFTTDCARFEGRADAATAVQRAETVATLLREVRAAPRTEGDRAPTIDATASLPGVDVRGRDGRVQVFHRRDVILDASPAAVSASVAGGTLREARVQFGGAQGAQPSIDLALRLAAQRWSVDLDADALPLHRLAPWIPAVPWHGTENGVARAHVRAEPMETPGVIAVDGVVAVENFGLEHRGLAHEPIDGLSIDVRGSALFDLARRKVASQGVSVRLNGLPFTLAGWVEHDRHHTAVDAALRVPDIECDAVRRALPAAVVGPVGGFLFTGSVGGDAHLALDTRSLQGTSFDFDVRDGCLVARAGLDHELRRFSGAFVQRVQEPNNVVRTFVTGPGTPPWVSLDQISPYVMHAVLTREDGGFYRHHGFSPDEIRGALVRNVSAGRFVYGASTISMQLVKNVFLAREKTLVRKLQEVALTWWLEQALDKNSILELYLNVVEFGPGIYGVGPASRFFFGREPRDLTVLQAVYLATLLPSPVRRFASYERGAVSAGTLAGLRHTARTMAAHRRITPAELEAAMSEAFTFRPQTAPVPGALTLNVAPGTSDAAAAELAERARRIYPAAPVREEQGGEAEGEPAEGEAADDQGVPTSHSAFFQ